MRAGSDAGPLVFRGDKRFRYDRSGAHASLAAVADSLHQKRRSVLNISLWTIQGLLALMFLMSGGMKVFAYEAYRKQATAQDPGHDMGLTRGFISFIGVAELAGALGLVLPMVTGIMPVLTPLAAVGLGIIMIGATRHHLRRQESGGNTIALLVLCTIVAVGRGLL